MCEKNDEIVSVIVTICGNIKKIQQKDNFKKKTKIKNI